jgi:hypothetical protein
MFKELAPYLRQHAVLLTVTRLNSHKPAGDGAARGGTAPKRMQPCQVARRILQF